MYGEARAAGNATFGVGVDVQEPPTGSDERISGPGVKIDTAVVGSLVRSDQKEWASWPGVRDWSLALQVARKKDPTKVLTEPPRVLAEINFGTGAAAFFYSFEIPVVGLNWHVASQWVSVRTFTLAPSLLPPEIVEVDVSIVPGGPRLVTVSERVQYEGGAIVTARAPQFARAVSVASVEGSLGAPISVTDGVGQWLYLSPDNLSVITPLVPLVEPGTAPMLRQVANNGSFIPSGANAVRLTPNGASGWHQLEWQVQL